MGFFLFLDCLNRQSVQKYKDMPGV